MCVLVVWCCTRWPLEVLSNITSPMTLWIRRSKSWTRALWAEGSFTSLFHVFLTVPSSSQVSLVQPWDNLEKSSFCSIAARWRVQTWGQLVRWSAGLPKPSWIIYVPDLATVPVTPGPVTRPRCQGALRHWRLLWCSPLGAASWLTPSCRECMFVFQYVLPARRPTRGSS